MWPSGIKKKLCSCSNSSKTGSLTSSSPLSYSSSSSTSSTPSPFSPLPNPRPLEDVWKDIRFSSLNVEHPSNKEKNLNGGATSFPPMIFQDFFVKETQTKLGLARCASPSPSPATYLRLNPGPDFPMFGNAASEKQTLRPQSQSDAVPLGGFCGCSGVNAKEMKRNPDPGSDSGDHRHKRMIKNRESASRSRARKQAYTNELEREVDNLRKEIANLKKQLNQFHPAAAAAAEQYPRKYALQRSLTSPF